eukprot:scaffold538148_cov18-Prasinocladus_malaysianus.AAC.1
MDLLWPPKSARIETQRKLSKRRNRWRFDTTKALGRCRKVQMMAASDGGLTRPDSSAALASQKRMAARAG